MLLSSSWVFASSGSIWLISCGQKHWSCGYILLPECCSLANCSEKPKDSLSYTGQLHLHHAYLFHWHCLAYWMAFLMMFQIVSNTGLIEHEWNGFVIGNITVIMIITTCLTTIAHCERLGGGNPGTVETATPGGRARWHLPSAPPSAARSHSHLMGTLGGAIQGFLQCWPSGRPANTGRACSPWGCLLERRGHCWKGKGHAGPLWGWGGLDGSGLFSFSFESTVSLFSLSGHPLTKGRKKKNWTEKHRKHFQESRKHQIR